MIGSPEIKLILYLQVVVVGFPVTSFHLLSECSYSVWGVRTPGVVPWCEK